MNGNEDTKCWPGAAYVHREHKAESECFSLFFFLACRSTGWITGCCLCLSSTRMLSSKKERGLQTARRARQMAARGSTPPTTRHALRALPRKDACMYAAVTTAALVQRCSTCRSIKWMRRNTRTTLDSAWASNHFSRPDVQGLLQQPPVPSCSSICLQCLLSRQWATAQAQSCILGSSHHIAWQIIRSRLSCRRTPQ